VVSPRLQRVRETDSGPVLSQGSQHLSFPHLGMCIFVAFTKPCTVSRDQWCGLGASVTKCLGSSWDGTEL
jgi:hypothetical protein